MANRFLSNIRINDAYTFPASDGSNGQVIVTDGSGNLAFANPATSSSASIIYRDNFTGDGSTVAFTLQNSLSDEDQTFIYIDGVYQEKGTYSLSTNTITFTTAPDTGHSIEVISVSGINVGPTTIYQDNFTGDGTTTDFTLAQSIDNEVKTMIYFNGVYQFKGTYSLNGTALSFDTAPANGVDIEVISIASAAAADYNQKVLFYGKANEAISKGDAIMLAGQEGDHFLLAKATQAAIAANHEYFLGLASQDLVQGEFGYVTEFGKIVELDTSGYTAGDILWFDAGGSTAGALTTTEPAPPLVKIQVAAVIRSHQNEGVLFIRPSWYHELGELHDVNITSVADKDMLVWDNANGYWENTKALGDITATSLAVDTDTLYIDAANNRVGIGSTSLLHKLQVNNGNIGLYSDSYGNTGLLRFFGTDNAERLQIGTSADAAFLYTPANIHLRFHTGGSEKARIDSSGNLGIGVTPSSWSVGRALEVARLGTAIWSNGAGETNLMANVYYDGGYKYANTGAYAARLNLGNTNGDIIFYNSSSSGTADTTVSLLERIRINSSGNVGINMTTPSYRLDVGGGGAFRDTLRLLANNVNTVNLSWTGSNTGLLNLYEAGSLTTQILASGNSYFNGGNIGIGTTSPTHKLTLRNDVAATTDLDPTTIKLYNNSDGGAAIEFSNAVAGNSKLSFGVEGSGGYTDETYIGFSTSVNGATASEKMRINSVGEVGIGTSNPVRKLVVSNGGANGIELDPNISGLSEIISYNRSTNSYTPLHFEASRYYLGSGNVGIANTSPTVYSGYKTLHIGDGTVGNTGIIKLGTGSTANGPEIYAATVGGVNRLLLNTNSSTNVIVLNGSNVGMGTDSPEKMLQLGRSDGTNQGSLRIYHDASGDYVDYFGYGIEFSRDYNYIRPDQTSNRILLIGNSSLYWPEIQQHANEHNWYNASGSFAMRLRSNGNLGINTTSAAYTLDVNGSFAFRGTGYAYDANFYSYDSNTGTYLLFKNDAGIGKIDMTAGDNISINPSGGNVGIGHTSPKYKLDVSDSIRTNDSVINWYQGTLANSVAYIHLKTNLWGGGGGTGNTEYTMSLFSAKAYFYSPAMILEGNVGFHNWSGTIYSPYTTGNIWSTPYISSDGYVVLVIATGSRQYGGVTIDWHQSYQYPFRTAVVTATSGSSSSTGAF